MTITRLMSEHSPTPSCLYSHELDDRAVGGLVEADHGKAHVEGRQQHLHALRGLGDALDAIGDVGALAHRPAHRAVGLEAEPLHAVRMLGEIGDPHPGRLDEDLARLLFRGHDADVVELQRHGSNGHWGLLCGSAS